MRAPIFHPGGVSAADRAAFVRSYIADLQGLEALTPSPVVPAVRSVCRELPFVRYCIVRIETPCALRGGQGWIGLDEMADPLKGTRIMLADHRDLCGCDALAEIERRYAQSVEP